MTDEQQKQYQKSMCEGMRNIAPMGTSWECLFAVGDPVMLRSGGQIMTIEGYPSPIGVVACVWFEGSSVRRDSFDQKSLKSVSRWKIWWNTNA